MDGRRFYAGQLGGPGVQEGEAAPPIVCRVHVPLTGACVLIDRLNRRTTRWLDLDMAVTMQVVQVSSRKQGTFLAAVFLAACTGCASSWWNSFLDPTQVGNFRDNNVNEIQQTISFRDTPAGVPNAVDPTPDDLVQTVQEYQIGVGDALSIRILDFIARDTESEFTPVVDELGYIFVPTLGYLNVQDMTARELRSEIVQRSKNAGIFRPDSDPTVVVTFLSQQQRVYNIGGSIQAPGRYRIIPPDFRLREAINQAGGLDPSIKTIFVIRNEPKPRKIRDRGARTTEGTPALPPDGTAPPVSPVSMAEMASGPNPPVPPIPVQAAAATAPSNGGIALPGEQSEEELLEAISPVRKSPADAAVQTPQAGTTSEFNASAPSTAPTLPPFIFVNDKFIESTPQAPGAAQLPPATMPAAESQPVPENAAARVDWEELAPGGEQRIIRVPAEKLMNGDPNYNVVIEPNDFIRLDAGHVGVFYLMGHVVRPGVYSLTGQAITLRQAIAAAGGLDALAWPTRCEITRRLDGDREETTQWDLARIMEGRDPDLYLKPDDVVNVGTHAIAPFLATIRNSFRLTYGFGFVYDRNFGDIDAYSPKNNPDDVRRSLLLQRFPGLFP